MDIAATPETQTRCSGWRLCCTDPAKHEASSAFRNTVAHLRQQTPLLQSWPNYDSGPRISHMSAPNINASICRVRSAKQRPEVIAVAMSAEPSPATTRVVAAFRYAWKTYWQHVSIMSSRTRCEHLVQVALLDVCTQLRYLRACRLSSAVPHAPLHTDGGLLPHMPNMSAPLVAAVRKSSFTEALLVGRISSTFSVAQTLS